MIWGLAGMLATPVVPATEVYQEPGDFLQEVFAGHPPAAQKLWIGAELQEAAKQILGHDLGVMRVSYWQRDNRTAWILEEIGKSQPITTGIVINDGRIEVLKVLIFRESRGWEVRYPFFTDQFRSAGMTDGNINRLDRKIDGISGATLSVMALEKLAILALLFHERVNTPE